MEIKTKNYTLYFNFNQNRWDWALPLHIEIEWLHHDYTEIWLHILWFSFDFTRISHKYSEELDDFYKEIKND